MFKRLMVVVSSVWFLADANAGINVPEVLNKMAGCFEVKFNYLRQDGPPYNEKANEYAVVDEKDGRIRVRRYLDVSIRWIVHWKEVWSKAGGDKWLQVVLDPDGKTERYRCESAFSEYAQRSGGAAGVFRRCEAKGAIAPRRYRKNLAVETLDRVSRVLITDGFWSDYQVNDIRDSKGALLFDEVGQNYYKKFNDDTGCAGGKKIAEIDEAKNF